MKRLILGYGILGKYIHKLTGWDYISRKKNDISFDNISSYKHFLLNYDEVINCIANTDVYSDSKDEHWDVNFKGVADLVDYCNDKDIKLIHISTSYLYAFSDELPSENDVPVHCNTWYGYTKLLSDGYIQLRTDNYLIIRCMHKDEPFKFDKAYINQVGSFDYVSVISNLIVKLIEKNASGLFNVGTDKKNMYELALRTKPDVEWTEQLFDKRTPTNLTMNIDKMLNFLKK